MDIVERDAMEFRPLGNKVHSYQRISPSAHGKGKNVASATGLDPESEDVVEYEVYHVSFFSPQAAIGFLILTVRSVNMGYPWI